MTATPAGRGRESSVRYQLRRVIRHARWMRTEGVGRLVEEDRLDPRERMRTAAAKRRWRRHAGRSPGSALPVYVVGLQRSGTNMLLRGLDAAPEVEVHGENDRELFSRFRLRPDETLREVLISSRSAVVLVKPLCDSHRVADLLDLADVRPGRAVWAVRDVDDRARSEVAKFGAAELEALRRMARGDAEYDWQRGGLDDDDLELVRSFDLDAMHPHGGAALFWLVRNRLYFKLGLDTRGDVFLSSYDALVEDPQTCLQHLCRFLEFPYRPELCAHVERRHARGRAALDLQPRLRRLCLELNEQLESTRRRQLDGLAEIEGSE